MDFDIAIIGAGPAGLSFACSLRDSGLKLLVIEKQLKRDLAKPANDGRDIALTHYSRELMQQQGSWQRIQSGNISPLKRAEVIDGDSAYTLKFKAPKKESSLGFLISNHIIRQAIYEEFESIENVTLMDETEVSCVSTDEQAANLQLKDGRSINVSMIVAADTRFSLSRQQMGISTDSHDFGRTAIVCQMQHELSHDNTAFECFHYGQTLAVLPMPNNTSSIVITLPSTKAKTVLAMSDEEFTSDIERRLNSRLGKMSQLDKRHSYPLVGVHANKFVSQRFALIGDAAVGMHPVTAHGFNLGLSGQDLLAKEIISANKKGLVFYSDSVLKKYQNKHMLMTRPLYHGTNMVVDLFTDDRFPATLVRKAVLRLSNNIPPIKWAIQHKLMAKKSIKALLPPFPSLF